MKYRIVYIILMIIAIPLLAYYGYKFYLSNKMAEYLVIVGCGFGVFTCIYGVSVYGNIKHQKVRISMAGEYRHNFEAMLKVDDSKMIKHEIRFYVRGIYIIGEMFPNEFIPYEHVEVTKVTSGKVYFTVNEGKKAYNCVVIDNNKQTIENIGRSLLGQDIYSVEVDNDDNGRFVQENLG